MAKFAQPTKKTEGYWKQNLGFTGDCSVCRNETRMLAFTYPSGPRTFSNGYETTMFHFSLKQVCSFECFKQTDDYVGDVTNKYAEAK